MSLTSGDIEVMSTGSELPLTIDRKDGNLLGGNENLILINES